MSEKLSEPKMKEYKKPVEQIVQEVLRGDWGNGEERRMHLESAGYNSNEIQKLVNEQVLKEHNFNK